MRPGEFVYKAIRDGAIAKGADEQTAKDEAASGFGLYKQNKFKTPLQLIEDHIKEAVRKTKAREASLL